MSRAQSVMMDFVLAAFVFGIVFSTIMLSLQNVRQTFDTEERNWRIQKAAINAADMLVKNAGVPQNWEDDYQNVLVPGLAGVGNKLSEEKLLAFQELDYNGTKNSLGLEGFQYHISIVRDGTVLLSQGRPPESDTVVSVNRWLLSGLSPVRIRLRVWEEAELEGGSI